MSEPRNITSELWNFRLLIRWDILVSFLKKEDSYILCTKRNISLIRVLLTWSVIIIKAIHKCPILSFWRQSEITLCLLEHGHCFSQEVLCSHIYSHIYSYICEVFRKKILESVITFSFFCIWYHGNMCHVGGSISQGLWKTVVIRSLCQAMCISTEQK